MRILFLTSAVPSVDHTARAAPKIVFSLLEAFAELGHEVSWATAQFPRNGTAADREVARRLGQLGVAQLADFSDYVTGDTAPRILRRARVAGTLLAPGHGPDYPLFREPERVAAALLEARADFAILFWDTLFERLLPHLDGLPSVAYWAKPPYASALARLQEKESEPQRATLRERATRQLTRRLLEHARIRHLQRARSAVAVSNICALDAAAYRERGIPAVYLPNTWPDQFGSAWRDLRDKHEAERRPASILGNIGGLYATGNRYGMQFLGKEMLSRLAERLNDWEVNICGAGTLPPDLMQVLTHPHVRLRGFVPDIDAELLSNQVFLLLNNVGPHTGGYTRAIYAFSSGACLIAHRRLAESMPEIRHDENALLGDTADEIAEHIRRAVGDRRLRRRLGEAARATYEGEFRPAVVAERLVAFARSAA